jgi:hypothetical protein
MSKKIPVLGNQEKSKVGITEGWKKRKAATLQAVFQKRQAQTLHFPRKVHGYPKLQ